MKVTFEYLIMNDDPEDEYSGWYIFYYDADGVLYDTAGAYSTEEEARDIWKKWG